MSTKPMQGTAAPIDIAGARALAQKTLSAERMHHTECVAEAAVQLAQQYGADPARAELAALLHDILKESDEATLLHWLSEFDIIYRTQPELVARPLWHAYAGGAYVKHELGLDDEIANAVAYHTAGRAGMSLLEKVVFLADYISADRDFRGADEVRELVKVSLGAACIQALRNGIIHICKKGRPLDINSILAYNDFIRGQE